jgi:hypothetical protein
MLIRQWMPQMKLAETIARDYIWTVTVRTLGAILLVL